MHRGDTNLTGFCDGEDGALAHRRTAAHLSACEPCRQRAAQIQSEKTQIAERRGSPPLSAADALPGLLAAITAWRDGKNTGASAELQRRVQEQIETYFGAPASEVLKRPNMRPEELRAATAQVLEMFLGEDAAAALDDEVFRKLGWAAAKETA
jgi:hypothetical protein